MSCLPRAQVSGARSHTDPLRTVRRGGADTHPPSAARSAEPARRVSQAEMSQIVAVSPAGIPTQNRMALFVRSGRRGSTVVTAPTSAAVRDSVNVKMSTPVVGRLSSAAPRSDLVRSDPLGQLAAPDQPGRTNRGCRQEQAHHGDRPPRLPPRVAHACSSRREMS